LQALHFVEITFRYPRSGLLGRGGTSVFEDFTWQSPKGLTVLLGPNGAGKTTLLSLGATALTPSAGTIRLGELEAGRRNQRRAFRQAIGWLPQAMRAIPGLTAREQVAYSGWLKGMSRSEAWREAETALARVNLSDEADRLTAQLSGGQQRRVGLAQLLVHQAKFLLLDEPTVGLDPGQRGRFRELLREVGELAPVVISTHQVDDLSELFHTVVVLDRGSIVFEGPVAAFMAMAPTGAAHPAEAAYASLIAEQL
jgi:ABC-2 type transport system ATP-binding protein